MIGEDCSSNEFVTSGTLFGFVSTTKKMIFHFLRRKTFRTERTFAFPISSSRITEKEKNIYRQSSPSSLPQRSRRIGLRSQCSGHQSNVVVCLSIGKKKKRSLFMSHQPGEERNDSLLVKLFRYVAARKKNFSCRGHRQPERKNFDSSANSTSDDEKKKRHGRLLPTLSPG